jgi:phosphoribosyl 1,2-cyclic phosphodiesterase
VPVLKVTFFGVRGSTPCCGPNVDRYGGNTACVVLEVPGEEPIVCDMGTGLRAYGATQAVDGSYRGTALVSHLHWDHVQGLPFFPPVLVPGARFDVYAPVQEDGRSVREAFDFFMQPPYFPIRVADLPSDITMLDCPEGEMKVGTALVTARLIPHIGNTLGYRIAWGGATVAYLPDHQQPLDGSLTTTDAVLELADGVDLLIHDAQYTPPEFARKSHWGHCTHEYAVFVAKEAGAKRLALFHHDPARDDESLDEVLRCLQTSLRESGTADSGVELFAAAEGLTISFEDG